MARLPSRQEPKKHSRRSHGSHARRMKMKDGMGIAARQDYCSYSLVRVVMATLCCTRLTNHFSGRGSRECSVGAAVSMPVCSRVVETKILAKPVLGNAADARFRLFHAATGCRPPRASRQDGSRKRQPEAGFTLTTGMPVQG